MLSKRAKDTIRKMGERWLRGSGMGGWSWSGGFQIIPSREVKSDLVTAKKSGMLNGVGQTTINEIICFHSTLIDIWPD